MGLVGVRRTCRVGGGASAGREIVMRGRRGGGGPRTAVPRRALVTGASSGLGREIAARLVELGFEVVVTGRNRAALEEFRGEHSDASVHILCADLADATAVDQLVGSLSGAGLSIDVLVNNAGLGDIGEFVAGDHEKQIQMLRVNIDPVVTLSRRLAEAMVERGSGYILNVASTAAFAPGPLMAVYYATKAFVLSFSLALREELKGKGVVVSTLCPGPTRTGFDLAAGAVTGERRRRGAMEAGAVARTAVRQMFSERRLIVPGLANKAAVLAVRLLPGAAVARYLHRFNSRK